MEIDRDRSKHTVKITMKTNIVDLAEKLQLKDSRKKEVPIPTTGYVVQDYEYEQMSTEKGRFLNEKEQKMYMMIVGCCLWIAGVRLDTTFAVMYLTWFTQSPRQHHLDMAYYLVSYLYHSRDVELILGGTDETRLHVYTDASLGTGKNRRSVVGVMSKLNSSAGAYSAKSQASISVRLASFETELDGTVSGFKKAAAGTNTLIEMSMEPANIPLQYNDNEAMIAFVHGEGIAKGVRHMELRMWYAREYYKQGNVELLYMKGLQLPADKLTKPSCKEEFKNFQYNIMGHELI
jgi:hypothetical protein